MSDTPWDAISLNRTSAKVQATSTLEGEAHLDALIKLNEWKNKAIFQVVKNRFGSTHYEGHAVGIDWNSMVFN